MRRNIINGLLMGILILPVFCFGQPSIVSGAEIVKIKGFYIGMSIDDALKNFERLGTKIFGAKEFKIKEDTYKNSCFIVLIHLQDAQLDSGLKRITIVKKLQESRSLKRLSTNCSIQGESVLKHLKMSFIKRMGSKK